jgi:protease-4
MPEEFTTPPPQPPTASTPPAAPPVAYAPPYAYAPSYAQAAPYAQPSPYPGYPQPPRRRHSAWFWISILGGSFAVIALLFTGLVWSIVRSVNGDSSATIDGLGGGSKIGVIDIDGIILDADKIDTQIRKFGDDSSVKAIILHINSPGGGAAASQEIYNEVVRVRQEKHKKIVASVESVGASGAYYIASGCDKIYANNASVVGSIGVIMEWTNYGDLLKWAKLKSVVIHAGTLKDAGDPTREMTPEEQAYFQSVVDNMYGQFVHDVAVGRHTTDDKIRPLATGQVWTGQQSLPLGLIDKIGGFRVALIDTARDAGIKGEPTIARPASDKKGLLATLTDDSDSLFPNPSKLLDQSPGFYFMWK